VRAREFITEQSEHKVGQGKPNQYFVAASPGAMRIDGLDKYYDLYRMSLHMAGSPTVDTADNESFISNSPVLFGYTDEEDEKIKYAAKRVKGSIKTIAPSGSRETDDVNRISPIKGFKGYPR